jgi:hypothetical protein
MTAATADRAAGGHSGIVVSGTVATGKTIFKDTMVDLDTSGKLEPMSSSALFAGVAQMGGTAGTVIKYERKGIFEMIMAAAGAGTVGDELYVVDDQTVATTGTTKVGRAAKYLNSGKIFIDITRYC